MNYLLDLTNLIPVTLFLFITAVLYPRLTLTAIVLIMAIHITGTPHFDLLAHLPPSYDWMAYLFLGLFIAPIFSILISEDAVYTEKIFGVDEFKYVNPTRENDILLKQT